MKESLRALLPLYIAAFVVLFCGISAVNSTIEESSLTFLTTAMLVLGVASSLWMRAQGADQRVVVWLASGMAVLLYLLHPSLSDVSRTYLTNQEPESLSSTGIGMVLEWATILFSFTLLTNHSLLFAIVPSMALIGLMSSENLNPEMVTYFLGFVLATVFLMGYHAHLERTMNAPRKEGSSVPIRPFVVLSSAVVAGAFILGAATSAPLKFVGREVFNVASSRIPAPNVPLPPVSLNGTESSMSLSGQTPNLTNAEVLRVRCPVGLYWRGAVYDRYRGDMWDSDLPYSELGALAIEDGSTADNSLFNLDFGRALKALKSRRPVNQIFATTSFAQTVYAAAEPFRIQGPMDRLTVDGHLAVRSEWSPNNLTYHVTSMVSVATPDELRSAPPLNQAGFAAARMNYFFGAGPAGIQEPAWQQQEAFAREYNRNLNLPYNGPLLRVHDRAITITAQCTNDYDRAVAIEQYLRTHFVYSLEPPTLTPNTDAADFFLFTAQKGYCEQFANAMAVMLRTLRVPARIAVGFAPGEYDSQTGEWVVRDRDAHAWVEVFFAGYGWIPFDPTAGVEPEGAGFFSIGKLFGRIVRLFASREFMPTLVLIAILGTFLYIVKTEAYDRYLRSPIEEYLRLWRQRRDPDVQWAVERNYGRLRKVLQRSGVLQSTNQTPLEYQATALAHLQGAPESVALPLQRMTEMYVEAAYSGRSLPPGSDRASAVWLDQVRQGLRENGRGPRGATAEPTVGMNGQAVRGNGAASGVNGNAVTVNGNAVGVNGPEEGAAGSDGDAPGGETGLAGRS